MAAGRRRLVQGRRVAGVAALLLALSPAAGRADDASCPEGGALAYYPCSSCHGAAGEGSEPFRAPPLAGLTRDYVVRQLLAFRRGARGAHPADTAGQEMTLLARSLADEREVDAVACHVASLLVPARPVRTLRGDPRRGARLYRACAACHGERAQGVPALLAPPLAQLPDWYLRAQLDAFRLGWRGADGSDAPALQMRAAVATLRGARDSADLASHIVTLR